MVNAKLIDRIRPNWRVEDVESVCAAFGIGCTPPRNRSHYKIKHSDMSSILTIPARRPMKPVCIRELVRFIDTVRKDVG